MSEIANKPKTRGNPTWVKGGKSPNANGRPPMTAEEREARRLMAEFTPEAVRLLIAHARGVDDPKVSMDALKHLTANLVRLSLEVSGPDGGPIETVALDPKRLTTEQLEAIVAAVRDDVDNEDE